LQNSTSPESGFWRYNFALILSSIAVLVLELLIHIQVSADNHFVQPTFVMFRFASLGWLYLCMFFNWILEKLGFQVLNLVRSLHIWLSYPALVIVYLEINMEIYYFGDGGGRFTSMPEPWPGIFEVLLPFSIFSYLSAQLMYLLYLVSVWVRGTDRKRQFGEKDVLDD
jgi:hypothetical protein